MLNNRVKKYPFWIESSIGRLLQSHGTDLFYNGSDHGFILKNNHYEKIDTPFNDANHMQEELQLFSLRQDLRLDPFHPFSGGHIYGSFRWQCAIPPASSSGCLFTLRYQKNLQQEKLDFAMSSNTQKTIENLMLSRDHILICGETGSGKTTFLTKLLSDYCSHERIILIEDVSEIALLHPGWVRLQTKDDDINGLGHLSFDQLIEESLRLRPDRMVCGEIRTKSSIRFFDALYSGHTGCLATVHSLGKDLLKARLNQMYKAYFPKANKFYFPAALWAIFMERSDPPIVHPPVLLSDSIDGYTF